MLEGGGRTAGGGGTGGGRLTEDRDASSVFRVLGGGAAGPLLRDDVPR